jgi:hypothetical protein
MFDELRQNDETLFNMIDELRQSDEMQNQIINQFQHNDELIQQLVQSDEMQNIMIDELRASDEMQNQIISQLQNNDEAIYYLMQSDEMQNQKINELQQTDEILFRLIYDLQQSDEMQNQLINELRSEIELLKQRLDELCTIIPPSNSGQNGGGDETNPLLLLNLSQSVNNESEEMILYQNAPNPFNENTFVKCYVPNSIKSAQLCVYNMQGAQLKCLEIAERGAIDIKIEAGALASGIYTYILIGDGKTSDAKQMILTK